ncbi:hypothetical protein CHGG_02510 [Chaetomium globosum CBS 148.51]|uniref:Uncharacterized protein n=1 Tax=Chaetomium globosum (strain ATCC 6205 / CBS 148.51 / DSM 1962 / NBRC 6347 / NRRL 1970) TaxID=306901 RepID=Q2HB94_CHAGB|nr:uncharacterized protein CHGG_02510 [Chaetomium globosum CBS 148.51]EAQ90575.1 hypothetical protein CHGG_02510 [Chaetomium globosum CBS 148.51]
MPTPLDRAMRSKRNLHPQESDSRDQLLERVRANLRIPRN